MTFDRRMVAGPDQSASRSHEGLPGVSWKISPRRSRGCDHRDLATDKAKRDMFDRLHQHLNRLADEVEQAINDSDESGHW